MHPHFGYIIIHSEQFHKLLFVRSENCSIRKLKAYVQKSSLEADR